MTVIQRIRLPVTEHGNDPNDNRHDPDYLNKAELIEEWDTEARPSKPEPISPAQSPEETDDEVEIVGGHSRAVISDEIREREAIRERRPGRMNGPVSGEVRTFVYGSHRTTKKQEGRTANCLALEFIDTATGEPAVLFFNIGCKGRTKFYRTGQGQQFNPPERGKFRRWWMSIVGRPPRRWCRVHKELKPRLSGLLFRAEVEHKIDRNQEPYLRLKNVRLAPELPGTVWAQAGHSLGTERAQVRHKSGTE